MACTINGTSTGNGGLISTGDDSGILNIQTNETTAISIDASQNATFAGKVTSAGALTLASNGTTTAVTIDTSQNMTVVGAVLSGGTTGQFLSIDTNNGLVARNGTHPTIPNISQIYTNGSERMRITSSGNLLVNTTSNVGANAKIFAVGSGQGIAVGSGTGSSAYRHLYMNSGDATLYFFNDTNYANLSAAGAWTNASDARLKKNIVDIKYGLSDVLRLQPRSYQMNSVDGDFVGFIAQELQTVIPEVVTGDPEKQLGVDYGSLVAVAFKAIQELKAINDTQAETLTQQTEAINALTARVVALESK
jgi:hypothetical protein